MLRQLDVELSLKQLEIITTVRGSYFYSSYFVLGINCKCKLEVSENLPAILDIVVQIRSKLTTSFYL